MLVMGLIKFTNIFIQSCNAIGTLPRKMAVCFFFVVFATFQILGIKLRTFHYKRRHASLSLSLSFSMDKVSEMAEINLIKKLL